MTPREEVPRLVDTRRKGPGKPSYADVVTERNRLRAEVERLTGDRDRALTGVIEVEQSRQEVVETLSAEREAFQVDRRAFDEALRHAATLMEKQAAQLGGLPGSLEYGCVHPHSPFPPDYAGEVVTDGVRWYCTRNHLRVAVLSRAGQV